MIVVVRHKYFTVEKTVEKTVALIKDNSQDWLRQRRLLGN
jgi:hypothetical protein